MALLDNEVLTFDIPQLSQSVPKRADPTLVEFNLAHGEITDSVHLPRRLRLGSERRGEEAARDQRYEGASVHHARSPVS